MVFRNYLLVYNRARGELIKTIDLGEDDENAYRVYGEYERCYGLHNLRHVTDIEVVLLGADSLETLKVTHAHYFDSRPIDELWSDLLAA